MGACATAGAGRSEIAVVAATPIPPALLRFAETRGLHRLAEASGRGLEALPEGVELELGFDDLERPIRASPSRSGLNVPVPVLHDAFASPATGFSSRVQSRPIRVQGNRVVLAL